MIVKKRNGRVYAVRYSVNGKNELVHVALECRGDEDISSLVEDARTAIANQLTTDESRVLPDSVTVTSMWDELFDGHDGVIFGQSSRVSE